MSIPLAALAIALTSSAAPAPPPAAWRPFELGGLIYSGAAGATALGLTLAAPAPRSGWRSEFLLDGAFRSAFRLSDPGARGAVDDASDVAVTLLMIYPFVDVAILWLGQGRGTLAREVALMNLEAYATASLLVAFSKSFVGRVRPYGEPCFPGDQGYACRSPTTRKSFLSGHSTSTFAAAGLICAHHLSEDIYGDVGDGVACGATITAALGVGFMRVASDQHWASDVIFGGALGFLAGYFIPRLLHYGDVSAAPLASAEMQGLAVFGRF